MQNLKRFIPVLLSSFVFSFTSVVKAYISRSSIATGPKSTKLSLTLTEIFKLIENNPNAFSLFIDELENKYSTQIYFTLHEENSDLILNCFDCDIKKVDSEIMLFAGNSGASGGPASQGSSSNAGSTGRQK